MTDPARRASTAARSMTPAPVSVPLPRSKTNGRSAATPSTWRNEASIRFTPRCAFSTGAGGSRGAAPAVPALFALLHLRDGDAGGLPVGFELHLVADLDLLEHLRILHPEDHRHAVFVHVEVLDGTVLQRDLAGALVDLLHLAVDHGVLRDGRGRRCRQDDGDGCC